MKNTTALKSQQDQFINFVNSLDKGYFEPRYVRRRDDYFIAYLSSHNGCNKGCHFCHLTATNQKYMNHASLEDYLDQANKVFDHYRTQNKALKITYKSSF